MPSPISPASAIMPLRRVARTTGGSAPGCPDARAACRRRLECPASGLPGVTPMRTYAGAWLTPMPSRKRPRCLVHEGGALSEVADRARVDRRDGGGEGDALGDMAQRLAQRHVGEHAGRIDAGETALLDRASDLQRGAPPSGHGHQADGGNCWGRHQLTFSSFCRERRWFGIGMPGKPTSSWCRRPRRRRCRRSNRARGRVAP